MSEGIDHDFVLPPGAFRTIFRKLAVRWPDGIAELSGGVQIPFVAVAERAPETLGDGFVAYRDAAARARFHRDGGFVDSDGESPLNVFLVHRGATHLHLDLVFDAGGSPAFSLAVHEAVGVGIYDALPAETGPEWAPMNPAWLARTLNTLCPYFPEGAVGHERAYFVALACWHRVRFASTPRLCWTQPPGRVTVIDGRLLLGTDDAGPSSKVMQM